MSVNTKTVRLAIGGMSCTACRNKITAGLQAASGVQQAVVSYENNTADVTYDPSLVTPADLCRVVQQAGYTAKPTGGAAPAAKWAGVLVVIAGLYLLLRWSHLLDLLVPSALAQTGMDLGALFLLGIVTSVHCIAMCGGINLSQSLAGGQQKGRAAALLPALQYNAGRVVSYTAIGFIVGLAGTAFTLSVTLQGAIKVLAGALMILMGLNMLGFLRGLHRFLPHLPVKLTARLAQRRGNSGPFVVGLLNGLMPCGPLQSMQLYALSAGSAAAGALSMLAFSLGTVPLMLGFGALGTLLTRRFAQKVVAAGAVLVVVLGLSMASQGITLSAPALQAAPAQSVADAAVQQGAEQLVESTLAPGSYPDIVVRQGSPVRWVINAAPGSINGCNYRMLAQQYGLDHTFTEGQNILTFTPAQPGSYVYSCWMGMITGTIEVLPA